MFFVMDAIIQHLEAKQDLSEREVYVAAEMLLDDSISDEKKAHFLQALSEKGETSSEITYFVQAFLERAVDPKVNELQLDGPTIDIVGTGGDKLDLFNVSTTSMFVIAAGGAVVLKHGNRGVTSKSGTADVLETLGIQLGSSPEVFRRCVQEAGVGFLFAPACHPAFKAVVGVRKLLAEKGVRTIFNLIGPLLNPARPSCQLVGVAASEYAPIFAEILQRLGRESAWVVCGSTEDGRAVDEMSTMGKTIICKSGVYEEILDEEVKPQDFGFNLAAVDELKGGTPEENAQILEDVLAGKDTGPKRDIVLLNAGAGLACAGLADNLGDGIKLAGELIDSGQAIAKLRKLQAISSELAGE